MNGSKYAPVPGKIPGRRINLGGVEFVMAPLNLDGVREYPTRLTAMQAIKVDVDDPGPFFEAAADVLLLSLARNYPDLTRDELVALLDMGNVREASAALREVSGFLLGEAAPASQSTP